MSIGASTLLFMDASALFVAARTPAGGSGYLLKIAQAGFLRCCSSPAVLHETERNLLAKVSASALSLHRQQVSTTPLSLVAVPPPAELGRFTPQFGKDDHVAASALAANADFLITLDVPLIAKIRAGHYSVIALTPKEFLEHYFPQHPEYAVIRSSVEP